MTCEDCPFDKLDILVINRLIREYKDRQSKDELSLIEEQAYGFPD